MWLRRSVQAFLAFLILAIGVSRVYLGAHWPSDVLGAYLLGGSLLALLLRGQQTNDPF
jgi:undecaprenyl-diphosphatase